jgi:hypothetical protein
VQDGKAERKVCAGSLKSSNEKPIFCLTLEIGFFPPKEMENLEILRRVT